MFGDLNFDRYRTKAVTSYDHKNGPRLCDATVYRAASTFKDEKNNDMISNQRGARMED
jgi:hypothetical protein